MDENVGPSDLPKDVSGLRRVTRPSAPSSNTSATLTTDVGGYKISETRWTAWGDTRYSSGTSPSEYTFTGQRDYTGEFGLMYFNARWVDVGRFAEADIVVPSA